MLPLLFSLIVADDPASTPAIKPAVAKPTPAPELEALKYFEGNWNCDGQMSDSAFGPEHKFKATFKVKNDLDKFWYSVSYEEKKSKDHPLPFAAHGFWNYDSFAKRYVRLFADAFGSSESGSSPGWDGDVWVWSGQLTSYLGEAHLEFRQTLTKKTPREFGEHFEYNNHGQWTGPVTLTCKK